MVFAWFVWFVVNKRCLTFSSKQSVPTLRRKFAVAGPEPFCCSSGSFSPRLSATMSGDLKFPENFLWGTATSPTQVEGHVVNEWTDYVGGGRRKLPHGVRPLSPLRGGRRLDVAARRECLPHGHRMVAPAGRAVRAAEPDGTGSLRICSTVSRRRASRRWSCCIIFPIRRGLPRAAGQSGAFRRSWITSTKLVVGFEGPGPPLEHVQRTGHLCVADISARRISAVSQMAFAVVSQSDQAHGRGAREVGRVIRPKRRRRPELGIAKNWTFFRRVPDVRAVGPSARGHFPSCASTVLCWMNFWAGNGATASTFLGRELLRARG